jgi:hypothetical protein
MARIGIGVVEAGSDSWETSITTAQDYKDFTKGAADAMADDPTITAMYIMPAKLDEYGFAVQVEGDPMWSKLR